MVHPEMCLEPETEQMGIRCTVCEKRLTFGKALVVDERYYCWEHYLQVTGITPATEGRENDPRMLE